MCHVMKEYNLAFIPDSVVRPEEGEERGELAGVLRHPPVRRMQHHVRSCKCVWTNLSYVFYRASSILLANLLGCQRLEVPSGLRHIGLPRFR